MQLSGSNEHWCLAGAAWHAGQLLLIQAEFLGELEGAVTDSSAGRPSGELTIWYQNRPADPARMPVTRATKTAAIKLRSHFPATQSGYPG